MNGASILEEIYAHLLKRVPRPFILVDLRRVLANYKTRHQTCDCLLVGSAFNIEFNYADGQGAEPSTYPADIGLTCGDPGHPIVDGTPIRWSLNIPMHTQNVMTTGFNGFDAPTLLFTEDYPT